MEEELIDMSMEEELIDRSMDEELIDRSYLSDADSQDQMNQARFLFLDDFDETIVPETPSPCRQLRSSKRRRLETDLLHPSSGFTLPSCSSSSSSSSQGTLPGGQHGEAILEGLLGSGSRVFEAHCNLPLSGGHHLLSTAGCILDSLLDPGSPFEARSMSGGRHAGMLEGLLGPGSGFTSGFAPPSPQSRKRGRTRTPRRTTAALRPPAAASPSPGGASLSFLTSEERRWVNGELPGAAAGTVEEICFSDEEDAVVRSLQLEEDEAMARSLQDQFDREEARPHPVHHHRAHEHNLYMEPRWTPPWLPDASSLQDDLIGRRRGRGRSRAPGRQTRATPFLSEDLQGNNYEALLQFEEQQGSVVNRNLMSRRQIDRFPTKTFSPAPNAANAQCHICFCDYAEGEQLRMLSCFHDYHVACIDRWLKDNATCPICRANMTES